MKPVETLSSHLSRRRSRVRVPSLPLPICRDFLKSPQTGLTHDHTCHAGGELERREARDFGPFRVVRSRGGTSADSQISGAGFFDICYTQKAHRERAAKAALSPSANGHSYQHPSTLLICLARFSSSF